MLSPTLTNQASNWDLWILTQCYPNTGLVKTTEPWPSVTSTLAQSRLLSPDPLLPKHWPNQDYWVSTCFPVSAMGWSWNSFSRWQAPSIPALVGVSSSAAFRVIPKITGGFRVLSPFTRLSLEQPKEFPFIYNLLFGSIGLNWITFYQRTQLSALPTNWYFLCRRTFSAWIGA